MKDYLKQLFENAGIDYKSAFIKEAGYYGYSKSNNAISAEEEGKFPASVAAKKLGVSTGAIENYISTTEWHHYSSHYNKVYVYDITPYLMLKNNEDMSDMYDEDEIEEYKQNYQKMKEYTKKEREKKKEEKEGQKYKANVEYIEWTGSRNYPKPIYHKYENIWVIEKGQYYTFILPNGDEVRKMKGSNGTYVDSVKHVKEVNKIMKERFKEFKKNTSLKTLRFIRDNNLVPNSSYTKYYVSGRKPTQHDYYNLEEFLKKGELRLCSKSQMGLSTSGAYLEQWNGKEWIPVEDNIKNTTENSMPIKYEDIKKFL